jgi:CubicO group peptidase (beta-lactamase class C family)
VTARGGARALVAVLAASLPPVPSQGLPRAADPVALGAALDAVVPAQMARRHLPGAVVVVADRDGALLARGYGVADLERADPVDPATTAFRVASVSKLFTATAVVQLHERGRLSLDEDVNRALRRFQVPATFPEPITLRHLLTHTAGLAERFLGHRARTREGQLALGDYLAGRLPARFAPPGRIVSYANHGMALAGLVVEEASGRPFPRYVAEEILLPLGMTSSGFGMEPALVARLATGYVFAGGRHFPVPVDFRHETPSGSLITTGADMARFLAAQLRGGELDGARILAPESVAAMHARAFGHHPRQAGVGLGFLERRVGGLRAVGHDGDIIGWSARCLLVPERGLGLFVAHTGADTSKDFADRVTEAVFGAAPSAGLAPAAGREAAADVEGSEQAEGSEHVEGADDGEALGGARAIEEVEAHAAPAPAPAEELARVAGTYRWTRGPREGMEQLVEPYPWAEFRVSADADGWLLLAAPLGTLPARRFGWVEPLLYRELAVEPPLRRPRGEPGAALPSGRSQARQAPPSPASSTLAGRGWLAFGADPSGRIEYLFLDPGVPMALERIGALESMPVQTGLLVLCLVFFAGTGALLAVRLARDRRARRSPAVWAALAVSCSYAAFLAAFPPSLGLTALPSDVVALPTWLAPPGNPAFYYGVPPAAAALLALPPVGLAASGLLAVLVGRAWRRRAWPAPARFAAALLALAGLGCAAWLARWDLLGYHP